MEEPTDSPSDESNQPYRRRRSNSPSRPNMSETDPSRPRESTNSMEEPTGSPSDASLPPMNLMLFGRKGIQRTSIGNIILSQSDPEQNISSDFLKRQAEVSGYAVTLVEVPSLATTPLSQEKLLNKCHHSISQCAPGINAFLLTLPGGHFTDEDKEEIQRIQTIFGPRVNDYIMILYTNVSCPKDKPVQDSLQENTNLEQQFPKGCFVLSQEGGHEEISEMLKQIKGKSDKCFTTDMFVEAQLEERGRLMTELEKEKKKIEKMLNSSPVIQNPDSTPDCVRIVLIGKTGVGKSATGNTILGREAFKCAPWGESVTTCCQKDTTQVNGRSVAVVDTPGLFDTVFSNEDVKKEIVKCFSLLAPGPHVFLLLLSIGTRMTPEEMETLKLIKETFGTKAEKFTIILFTKGDHLSPHSIEQYIKESDGAIQQLISDCEGRYHVFNNIDKRNSKQVTELMEKIDRMVEKNGVGCYTNEMFQMAEAAIKQKSENIMREREVEIQREKEQLQAKFDEEIRAMMDEKTREIQREREEREKLLREKEELIKKKLQRRDERERREREEREAEDKIRREKEETQRQSWTRTLEEVERKHKEQKEAWEMEHKKQLREEKERAAKEHKEWIDRQRKERSEFERKQEAERRIKDEEKWSRREKEELERQKLEARVKGAEQLTKIHKERIKELREWEDKHMKEKLNEQKEREEWEKAQKKMKEDFETEKERARKERDSKEEAQREQERKERERIEIEHAEQIEDIKRAREKQEREWTKAREEETERWQKEGDENLRKLRELQDEFEREKEKEKKRKKEDEDREEEHKKNLKKIEEQNQNTVEMLTEKYENEAREKAELNNEFLQQKVNLLISKAQDQSEIDQLKKTIKEWEDKNELTEPKARGSGDQNKSKCVLL